MKGKSRGRTMIDHLRSRPREAKAPKAPFKWFSPIISPKLQKITQDARVAVEGPVAPATVGREATRRSMTKTRIENRKARKAKEDEEDV